MLNYLKKFAVDIFPSVAATVIGAYIVNHYIVAKPNTDAPPAAAASTADPKGDGKAEAKLEASKPDAKPAETTASVSNLPAAGVKAKGISEKAVMEKTAAERPAAAEKAQGKTEAKTEAKADEKADSKPVDTKSGDTKSADAKPAEPKSEKIRVILPSPIQPVQSSAAPAAPAAPVAVTAPLAPVEAAAVAPAPAAPEERRDANDLARAAIERLRANSDAAPRAPEMARVHEQPKEAQPKEVSKEAPKVATVPVTTHAPVAAPALRPLPPPIMVAGPPASDPLGQAPSQQRPPYAETANPNRPIPPADIPVSRPLDLRADMAEPSVRDRATAAAEDALSTAKSIFHAVLPK